MCAVSPRPCPSVVPSNWSFRAWLRSWASRERRPGPGRGVDGAASATASDVITPAGAQEDGGRGEAGSPRPPPAPAYARLPGSPGAGGRGRSDRTDSCVTRRPASIPGAASARTHGPPPYPKSRDEALLCASVTRGNSGDSGNVPMRRPLRASTAPCEGALKAVGGAFTAMASAEPVSLRRRRRWAQPVTILHGLDGVIARLRTEKWVPTAGGPVQHQGECSPSTAPSVGSALVDRAVSDRAARMRHFRRRRR